MSPCGTGGGSGLPGGAGGLGRVTGEDTKLCSPETRLYSPPGMRREAEQLGVATKNPGEAGLPLPY